MTVLVDWQIEAAVKSGDLSISPFDDAQIQPNSYDVRLGNEFATYLNHRIIDSRMAVTDEHLKYFTVPNGIIVHPRSIILGTTIERVELPNTICAEIMGRSSFARLGIELHQTAGWIDAGFQGNITLEICNNNTNPVILHPGDTIGQLVFHRTEACHKNYGKRSNHYQGQTSVTGPRLTKGEMND